MPTRPPKLCAAPGCHTKVRGVRYCPDHEHLAKRAFRPYTPEQKRAYMREYRAKHGSSHARGYTQKWHKYSRARVAEHPLCIICGRAATCTDHIKPFIDHETGEIDYVLFWDPLNHQSLCASCHGMKTAVEDSTFARRGRRRRTF